MRLKLWKNALGILINQLPTSFSLVNQRLIVVRKGIEITERFEHRPKKCLYQVQILDTEKSYLATNNRNPYNTQINVVPPSSQ